jgi:hypothetical protein
MWDGLCNVCRTSVRAGEGVVASDAAGWRGWVILCPEHMRTVSRDLPLPPDASMLPSIHVGDEQYEH